MGFELVAERERETVRMKHDSSLIALAKARVWASEGWKVTIVVGDENAPRLVQELGLSMSYLTQTVYKGEDSMPLRPCRSRRVGACIHR